MCTKHFSVITDFLTAIGISVIRKPINSPTFLPGLQLEDGNLIIDEAKLLYPGDVLHEAGHLATMPPDVRKTMNDNLADDDLNRGGEIMTLAWSYAACLHLKFGPELVFHPYGYKGESKSLIQNFAEGKFLGLPLLQWAGMTYDEKKALEFNTPPYPHMICWVRKN